MRTTFRLSVRTGVVGAWALMVGVAILVLVERLLALVAPATRTPPLTTAGVPLGALVASLLTGLYNGGAAAVLIGIVLIALGWYRLLSLA